MDQKDSNIPVSFTGTVVYAEPLSGRKVVDDDLEIYRPEDYNFTVDFNDESVSLTEELENRSGKVIVVIGDDEPENDSYARLPIAGSRSVVNGVINTDESVKDSYEIWATTDDNGNVQLDLEPPSTGLIGAVGAILRAILPFISPKSVPDELKREFKSRSFDIINADLVEEAEEKQADRLSADPEELDIGLAVGELGIEEMADGSVRYNAFVINEYTTESPVNMNISEDELAL